MTHALLRGTRPHAVGLVVALLLVLSVCTTVVPSPTYAADPPQPDTFFRPPTSWKAKKPGAILRVRPVSIAAFGVLPLNTVAWQLLYRTTDGLGHPSTTVTTVIKPSWRASGLVSYQIAEDASGPQCAPSSTLRQGGGEVVGSALNQVEIVMIAAAVGAGHVVSVPDWEGRAGSLFTPRQPGYAILDGIRAAERFARLGLPGRRTRVAAWGYSGGGFATGWAAQVQPRYAPDLTLVGAAFGGPITRVRKTFAAINGGPFAGFYPSILPGMLRANPGLRTAFSRVLTTRGKTLVRRGDDACLVTHLAASAFLDMDRYLTIPWTKLLGQTGVRTTFSRMNLGGTVPRTPMLVYQAAHDELVLAPDTAATVSRWCSHDARIRYVVDGVSEHGTLMITGGPIALNWINARLAGAAAPKGCSTRRVASTLLTPESIKALPDYLRSDLTALLPALATLF